MFWVCNGQDQKRHARRLVQSCPLDLTVGRHENCAGDEIVEVNGHDVDGDPDRLVSLISMENSSAALLHIKVSLSG